MLKNWGSTMQFPNLLEVHVTAAAATNGCPCMNISMIWSAHHHWWLADLHYTSYSSPPYEEWQLAVLRTIDTKGIFLFRYIRITVVRLIGHHDACSDIGKTRVISPILTYMLYFG